LLSEPDLVLLSDKEIDPNVQINIINTIKLPKEWMKKNILSYLEKVMKNAEPEVRCEGIKALSHLLEKVNIKQLSSHIEQGLRDKDIKVRHETAITVRELCRKHGQVKK